MDPEQVRRGYDRWAAIYDGDANPLVALDGPEMRRAVGDPRGFVVLDLGCGTGRHSLWLAGEGAFVTAVDFSEGMLAEARRKPGSENVRFIAHDLHKPLPLADHSFDLLVSGLVLDHIREFDHFFGEARRVLRPGGRAVVSTLHPVIFALGTEARFTDPATGEIVRPGSRTYTLEDVISAATTAGFQIVEQIERPATRELAERAPRAEKYLGCQMLFMLILQ